jgi:hypothetical protein
MIDDRLQSHAHGWLSRVPRSPLALILVAAIAAIIVLSDRTTESVSERQGVVTATEAADGVIPSLAPQEDTNDSAQAPADDFAGGR